MDYVFETDLEDMLRPGNVVLIKIDEVGSKLTQLKNNLTDYENIEIITEVSGSDKLVQKAIKQGKTPILLLDKESLKKLPVDVKITITHKLKISQYISKEVKDIFIF